MATPARLFNLMTFAPPCAYVAIYLPERFGFLTYWTLAVHALYFLSALLLGSSRSVRILHSVSFVGAWAVLVSYSQMAVAGSLHWGSFYEWERRIGNKFLVPYFYLHLEKAWEHLLPVIALELDARAGRDSLRQCYAGTHRAAQCAIGTGLYLALGVTWEQTQQVARGTDFFANYALPPHFKSSALIGAAAAEGLPDDFVFSQGMKAIMLVGAVAAYLSRLRFCFAPAAPKDKAG